MPVIVRHERSHPGVELSLLAAFPGPDTTGWIRRAGCQYVPLQPLVAACPVPSAISRPADGSAPMAPMSGICQVLDRPRRSADLA